MKSQKIEDYRPQNYWDHDDPLDEILAGIGGKARRAMIRDYWNEGRIEELDETLLKDELAPEERKRLGRIHPFFMGGEYLPSRFSREISLVRIELESATHDVIELRAHPLPDGKIKLRWVDEYESTFTIKDGADIIEHPFTFSELKQFVCATQIDGDSPLPLCFNEASCPDDDAESAERLRNFTTLDSEYYPELSNWFEQLVEEWIESKRAGEDRVES
ncbi:MAG: hypothetical protein ACN6I3_00415 [bacterium]